MRKAVAVWLVDNTCLTFDQIAEACDLHVLEVNAIADGEVAAGLVGCDPCITGEVEQTAIEECEKDQNKKLIIKSIAHNRRKKPSKRSGVSAAKRGVKPAATLWLIQNYTQLTDSQIVHLIKTTAKIVKSIRDESYWNYANLKPVDPVLHNLYSQEDLDELLLKVKISEQSEREMMNVENTMKDSVSDSA